MTDVHHCLPQAVPKNAHRVEFAVHNLTRVVADKRRLKTPLPPQQFSSFRNSGTAQH
jgi:hypothetical protein